MDLHPVRGSEPPEPDVALAARAFASAPDAHYVLEPVRVGDRVVDFVFTAANDAGLVQMGAPRVEIVGRRLSEFLQDRDRDRIVHGYRQVLETGFPAGRDMRIDEPDGTARWLHHRAVSLGGSLLVSTADVTDRKRVEAALVHSQRRFEALVRNAKDAVAIIDRGRGVVYVSPAINEIFGYRPEEIMDMDLGALVHPEDRPGFWDALGRAFDDPDPHTVTVRARHKDGSWRWVESNEWNQTDDPDVRGLVVHFRDVTDQVEAERRLRASEERYASLARNSTDVVSIVTPGIGPTFVSAACETILGYSSEEFLSFRAGDIVHPDDVGAFRDAFTSVQARPSMRHRVEGRLRHADGRWRWFESTVYNAIDEPAVGGIVVHFHDVTDRHTAEQELVHQALHDTLTGLPNRALLLDRLGHSLARARRRDRSGVAVFFLDLDNFKVVNDSLGHAAGDDLLSQVADRLRATVRPADTVARLGGDEFVVCCEDLADDAQTVDLAERVLEAFRRPFLAGEREVHISTSLGIAIPTRPDDTPETLLRDADAAMYVAKGNGRDRFEMFDDDVRTRVLWRMETEAALHQAIGRDELVVHYQPVWDLTTGHVVGTEALVRWQHPTRGLLPPDAFIPVAEESGLIVPLGEWVLERACSQLCRWVGTDPSGEYSTMWVNISAHQLRRPDFAEVVERILAETGAPADRLGLELTESVLMHSDQTSNDALARLSAQGCRVGIDDFGTGYSSLLYVQRYAVDLLKIDTSFVAGLGVNSDDDAIVQTIITLGELLDIQVTAEGVETEEQLAALRALGCGTACGFLLARPGTADEVTALLRAGPTR